METLDQPRQSKARGILHRRRVLYLISIFLFRLNLGLHHGRQRRSRLSRASSRNRHMACNGRLKLHYRALRVCDDACHPLLNLLCRFRLRGNLIQIAPQVRSSRQSPAAQMSSHPRPSLGLQTKRRQKPSLKRWCTKKRFGAFGRVCTEECRRSLLG